MGGVLPTVFVLLAAAMLLLALVAIWQSLRSAFGAADVLAEGLADAATVDRQALLDEKASLLRNIKDLEFENQVGKISDTDFQRLHRALRGRAVEVLRLLDEDLGPYRERAEAMIREHLQAEISGAPYREPGEPGDEDANEAARDARACEECGTKNDADAKFCKQCAHAFDTDGESNESSDGPRVEADSEDRQTGEEDDG